MRGFAVAFLCACAVGTAASAQSCPEWAKVNGVCPSEWSADSGASEAPSPRSPAYRIDPAAERGEAASAARPADPPRRQARDGYSGEARSDAPLTPARAYLAAANIPPQGYGAYGVVSLTALPTANTRLRLTMICESYKAHFPANSDVPPTVQITDRMLTIWPVKDPSKVRSDECAAALSQYDLYAAQSAISDAKRQGQNLDGQGPFLIGWSPAQSRGRPDRLVLVVDLSDLNSQSRIDEAFRFWRHKIIDDPELWRRGFSLERLRLSLRDFADRYGRDLTEIIKVGGLPASR